MTRRDKSRQEWEQEIVRRQQNISPADYPEGLHYAKIDGLPKVVSQVRFWVGIVLFAIAVMLFRSIASTSGTVAAALIAAAGLLIVIRAIDWSERHR